MIINYDVSDVLNKITAVAEDLEELSTETAADILEINGRVDTVAEDLSDLSESVGNISEFDTTPIENSTKAVTSGGVYNAIRSGQDIQPSNVEFLPGSTSDSGGKIAFHYNNSDTATSSLEENASGEINLTGKLKFNGNTPLSYQVDTVSSVSCNRNTSILIETPLTKEGYFPLSIAGIVIQGDANGEIVMQRFYLVNQANGSATARVYIRNVGSTNLSNLTVLIATLWSAMQ